MVIYKHLLYRCNNLNSIRGNSKSIIKLKEFITIIVEQTMKTRRRRNLSDMSENSEDYIRSK